MTLNMLRRRTNRAGRPARLKLSRWLPYRVRDNAGRDLGLGFREGYLHPTKGLRKGALPALGRWPHAV